LKWYDGRGENGITSKRIFEVEVFFSYRNIHFPVYFKTLLELFFFLLFFLSFLYAPPLEDSRVLMIFEEMGELWIYRWWTHIPEWRYARQYFWVRLANNFFLGSKSF
jgi:hypothetical protein